MCRTNGKLEGGRTLEVGVLEARRAAEAKVEDEDVGGRLLSSNPASGLLPQTSSRRRRLSLHLMGERSDE